MCCLRSRCFASDVLSRPRDGRKTFQYSLPRGVQKGPKTAPRAPKSTPRADQEGPRRALMSL
eukprot:8513685-Pyramimonas_sp.AAC.1